MGKLQNIYIFATTEMRWAKDTAGTWPNGFVIPGEAGLLILTSSALVFELDPPKNVVKDIWSG